MIHTSTTSPLQIATPEGFSGLGMSICPGKVDPHAMSGACERDLTTDVDCIKQWGACVVITLMEDEELSALHVRNLGRAIEKAGMIWWHFAVMDGSALKIRQRQADGQFWDLPCAMLRLVLSLGGKIFIHCRGGLGRTGTLAARILIEDGYEPESAISLIRKARPGAIETQEQEDYLQALPQLLRDNRKRNVVRACILGGAIGDAVEHSLGSLDKASISRSDVASCLSGQDTLRVTENTLLTLFTAEALIRAYTLPSVSSPRIRPLHAKIEKLQKRLDKITSIEASKLRMTQEHSIEVAANAPNRLKYLHSELCTQYYALRDWRLAQCRVPADTASSGNGSLLLRCPKLWATHTPDNVNIASLASEKFFADNSSNSNGSILRLAPIGLLNNLYGGFNSGDDHAHIASDLLLESNMLSAKMSGDFLLGFDSSRLTHGGPVAALAAGAWVKLVNVFAFDKQPVKERLKKLRASIFECNDSSSTKHHLNELIQVAFTVGRKAYITKSAKVKIPDEFGNGNIADEALVISMCCALAHRKYEDALVAAIGHNKGSNGIAVLMSQLWGLLHGQRDFPAALKNTLCLYSTIIATADALAAVSSSPRDIRTMVGVLWPTPDFSFLTNPDVNGPHQDSQLEGYAVKRKRFRWRRRSIPFCSYRDDHIQ